MLTYEEVMKSLETKPIRSGKTFVQMLKVAVGKQIPTQTVFMFDDCYGICDCGTMVCEGSAYCSGYGQRQKWGKS